MNVDWEKLAQDGKLAGKLVEGHLQSEAEKKARGAIGSLFGNRINVPGNVAALIAAVAAVVLVVCVASWAGKAEFTYKDAIAALSSLVTLTVGFLFGRATRD